MVLIGLCLVALANSSVAQVGIKTWSVKSCLTKNCTDGKVIALLNNPFRDNQIWSLMYTGNFSAGYPKGEGILTLANTKGDSIHIQAVFNGATATWNGTTTFLFNKQPYQIIQGHAGVSDYFIYPTDTAAVQVQNATIAPQYYDQFYGWRLEKKYTEKDVLDNATGRPNDRGNLRPVELSCNVHLNYPDSSKFMGTLVWQTSLANPRMYQLKPSRNHGWMLFMADGTHILIDPPKEVAEETAHADGFSTDNNWTGKVDYENGDVFEGKIYIIYDHVKHKWTYNLNNGTLTSKDGTVYTGAFRNNRPINTAPEKDNSTADELAQIKELIEQGETEKACTQLNELWLKKRDKEAYMLKRKYCN